MGNPYSNRQESIVSISRKRKKELRRLQNDANQLWAVSYTHLTLPTIYSV